MSQGKYSPAFKYQPGASYAYNAVGEVPVFRTPGSAWDEKIHYAAYDAEGYDRYGYSAWYADGTFAGDGRGVDRLGYTEAQYINMTAEEYEAF